jgi:hypothetical protein
MEPTKNLPTVAELFSEDIQTAFKHEQLNALLNSEPKPDWIKVHPFVKGHKYLPIDKVEYLLRRIFKRVSIEITGNGTSFNGVWVTVRVHYLNPVTQTMEYHDGIAGVQMQTKAGTSPADLININNGALSMALPIAKTEAIKDACHHFGKLFGADLNRKDTLPFSFDTKLKKDDDLETLNELFLLKRINLSVDDEISIQRIIDEKEIRSYKKAINNLASL